MNKYIIIYNNNSNNSNNNNSKRIGKIIECMSMLVNTYSCVYERT